MAVAVEETDVVELAGARTAMVGGKVEVVAMVGGR